MHTLSGHAEIDEINCNQLLNQFSNIIISEHGNYLVYCQCYKDDLFVLIRL